MSSQGPLPYIRFCGVEVANAARTVAYLRNGLGEGMQGHFELGSGDLCGVLYRSAPGVLTMSGNEITDATREAGVQGDGLTPPAGVGIWQAATNLCPNGGFESSLNAGANWVTAGGIGTLTRSTAQSKFGSASAKFVGAGAAITEGPTMGTLMTTVAATTYTASAWVYSASGGESVRIAMTFYTAVPVFVNSVDGSTVVLAAGWQRLTVTGVAGTGGVRGTIAVQSMSVAAQTWWTDGVQFEAGSIATPYIETDDATATRNGALVQAPAALLDVAQGWGSIRLRVGAEVSAGNQTVFGWTSGGYMAVGWEEGAKNWFFVQSDGSNAEIFAGDITPGDEHILVFAWTATEVMLSVDGSAFTTGARAGAPSVGSTFSIGSFGSSQFWNGDVLWAACGKGVLSDANAARFATFLTPPDCSSFPEGIQTTAVWEAINSDYETCMSFISPVVDPAPWYDATEPGSADFLGLILLDLSGYDSVITRSVAQKMSGLGGGSLSRQYRIPRTWKFQAAMISSSDAGAEYGLRWLNHVLQASECDACSGCDVTVRLVCPADDGSDDSQGEWISYSCALTDGPRETDQYSPGVPSDTMGGCRDVVIVEWTMVAENPWLYKAPVACSSGTITQIGDCDDYGDICEFLFGGFISSHGCTNAGIDPNFPAPAIGILAPIFTLSSDDGMGAMIAMKSNCIAEVAPDQTIEVTEIPAGTTVTIDCSQQTITVTDNGTGEVSDGAYLLDLPPGTTVDWPQIRDCDDGGCFGVAPAAPCVTGTVDWSISLVRMEG